MGAGEVGFDVARMLALEQHDVVVVDLRADALDVIREKLDVMTVQGSATSAHILEEAGIRRANMLIAVTAVDEVNIITCMLGKRLGAGTTIARVRADALSSSNSILKADDFGIDLVIHPEESAAAEVARLIRRAGASDVLPFAEGRLHLVGMRLEPTSPAVGRTLREVAQEGAAYTFRVMAIGRGIRTILPRGDEKLRANDQVFVLAQPNQIPHVARLIGKTERKIQHVMILGGSPVGARVAQHLLNSKFKRIKLIEPSRERAERLAEELEDVLVIHGEATDIDLLAVEGLGEMDAFVAVTDDEESNLVTCLLAKHLGVQKTVALLSKPAYVPISQSIGLDAAVSKKLAVSREVMRFLRRKHVLAVATVQGLDAEILEIEAKARSPVTRSPLKDLPLPRGVLIGAVIDSRSARVAVGETQINPGDRAIVFAMPGNVADVERYFDKP